jgi:hypothetical protein
MGKRKDPEFVNAILSQNNKARGIILPAFEIYFKTIAIRTKGVDLKTGTQTNATDQKCLEVTLRIYSKLIFDKDAQNLHW